VGNANNPERDTAMEDLTKAWDSLAAITSPDQAGAKDAIAYAANIVRRYKLQIESGELTLAPDGQRSLQIEKLIARCESLLKGFQLDLEEQRASSESAEQKMLITKLCPGALRLIDAYDKLTKRGRLIDLVVFAGRLADLPRATRAWDRFDEDELRYIAEKIPMGAQRDAARTAWYDIQNAITTETAAIQAEQDAAKKQRDAEFAAALTQAEGRLGPGWAPADVGRLHAAVTRFQQKLARFWYISPEVLERFCVTASYFKPPEVLLGEGINETPPGEWYDMEVLLLLGHASSHAVRIRFYVEWRVAPLAHLAGLDARNPAVISFVQTVATEWCSSAETADTGGSMARVNNFSRGDVIKNMMKDLPDGKADSFSLYERIGVLEADIGRENDPGRRAIKQRTLDRLRAQLAEQEKK
jgi:hypothetical protein